MEACQANFVEGRLYVEGRVAFEKLALNCKETKVKTPRRKEQVSNSLLELILHSEATAL